MKQTELINWAISGVKTKRIAFWNGVQALKETNPDAAEKLRHELWKLNEKHQELEKMLEEAEAKEAIPVDEQIC